MTDFVSAVEGSTVRPDWALPADESLPNNEIGKDEFLQLLVAQLKYQDPLEPQSSDQFISTTAQFTVVEKLDELTKQGANTALVNSLTTAGTLVGREVTTNRDGVPVTAVVERSTIRGDQVVLETNLGEISLNEIVSVGAVPSAAPTPDPEPSPEAAVAVPILPLVTTTAADEELGGDDTVAGADTQSGNGLS